MKWNGNGNTSGTVGHGLGAVPDMIIEKYGLDGTSNWGVAFPKFETSRPLFSWTTFGFKLFLFDINFNFPCYILL